MEKFKIYRKDIVLANILSVAAGTTGLRGGDSGHGCRTLIEIEDAGATDISFKIDNDKKLLTIELGGDSELETIIEGLAFIIETLKANKDSKPCGT